MDRKDIEELIEKRVLETKLAVTESRLNHVLVIAGALLAVFGIFVPIWLTNTSTDKTDKAIDRMEQRFKELAGEALKRPSLELLEGGVPLENRTIDFVAENAVQQTVELGSLFLKNSGEKRTEPLSIRVSAPSHIGLAYGDWEGVASSEREYAVCFYSKRHDTIAPGETLNMHSLALEWRNPAITNADCKIQVFYGGERPAEARFQLRLNLK